MKRHADKHIHDLLQGDDQMEHVPHNDGNYFAGNMYGNTVSTEGDCFEGPQGLSPGVLQLLCDLLGSVEEEGTPCQCPPLKMSKFNKTAAP